MFLRSKSVSANLNKQEFVDLIKVTFTKWQGHDASLRAAALTFFAIMPLPSLALIAVAILAQAVRATGSTPTTLKASYRIRGSIRRIFTLSASDERAEPSDIHFRFFDQCCFCDLRRTRGFFSSPKINGCDLGVTSSKERYVRECQG